MPSRTRSRSASPLPAAVVAALRRVDPAARPASAALLGAGYAYAAYRVPSPSGDWAVRLPKRTDGEWGHDRVEDLEREVRFFSLLADYDFGTTVLRETSLLRDPRGRTLGAVHRYVPGAQVATAGLPRGAAREALARDLARFLSRLHAVPLPIAKQAGLESVSLGTSTYTPLTKQSLPYLGEATARWLRGMTEAFLAGGGTAKAPRRVIHADISPAHVLLDGRRRLSGVIDFGDILVADPALDFAGLLNIFTWRDLESVWTYYEWPLDADVERRVRYYIAVQAIFQVAYGADGVGPQERADGIRRLTARAAAAARRTV
ncbi:MAG: aminoglycoside phosphotransferase family protein [Chloroflexi bacterium]|nr:aminoglycoside phosphotransferase family protein [Chloroflexota bacterium]